jgi:hypothetical protein
MGNFRVDTFSPWLGFEVQDEPRGLRASDGFHLGLTPLADGATTGGSREVVGLSNWRPPGTSAVLQSEPRPWWLFGNELDPNTPWLYVRPPDGPPGFRVAPDGTVASGPEGNRTALGLDQQVSNVGPASPLVGGLLAQHPWPPTDQPADTQAGWFHPLGQGEGTDSRVGLHWPWLRAEATEEPTGLGVTPNGSIAPSQTGNGDALGLDWQASNVGPSVPFLGGPFAQQTWPMTEPPLEAKPWWSAQPRQGEGLEDRSDLRWPWLRAEPTEPLGSGLKPEGSGDQPKPDEFNPLSFASQPLDQMPPESFVADGTARLQVGVEPTPLDPSQQPSGVDGRTAASMALPTAPAVAGYEAAGAVLAEAAARARQLAPAAARAASGPAAALSVLVTPMNSQGETIELGDGLRARTSPGQRSVKIERRADNGLLGTGFAARWETLPVDAELRVEKGGEARVLIDHQRLQAAVGPEATARALDAIGSKMARPPKEDEGDSRPQANAAKEPEKAPNPDNDRKPPNWPSALASTAPLAAKIWEQVNRPRSEAEDEARKLHRHVGTS